LKNFNKIRSFYLPINQSVSSLAMQAECHRKGFSNKLYLQK